MKSKERLSYPINFSVIALTALFFTIVSCQDYNSHSSDATKFAGAGCTPAQTEPFCSAYKVLRAKCANCHNKHNHWATETFRDEEAWKQDTTDSPSLIVVGNLGASRLYQSLKNYGDGTMPKNASPLSQAEATAIKDWIESL